MMTDLVTRCAREYLQRHPGEAATVVEALTPQALPDMLCSVSASSAEAVLRYLPAERAATALAAMPEVNARAIVEQSDFVQAARWLGQCDEASRSRLLGLLPAVLAKNIESVAEYPPGSAGRLMDSRFLTFRATATVDEVLETIRGVTERRITDVLITDPGERLTATVSLQSLVAAGPGARIGSVANTEPVRVSPLATQDEVVELLRLHNLASLPVVDQDSVLIGVLRHGALVQVAQAQARGDLQQMVGASEEERALSSPLLTVKSRLPWLLINLLTAFAAASVVGLFDKTIAQFTALAVLMPVVAGQSGNTGAQALAVTSRGLALREVRIGHWFRVLNKELVAALCNGVAVALVTCGSVYWWSGSTGLVAVIGISMVASMLMAALAGAAIPMVLTALRRDPAVAASIILTTVTDIVGFFSFLGLATLMSSWMS